MRFFTLLSILIFVNINGFGQYRSNYFNGGIQCGLGVNTIYKFTDELGYFEEYNYGKKLTGTLGFYVNRNLNRYINFETGLFYSVKGTRYKVFQTPMKMGNVVHSSDMHYIGFPVVINQMKKHAHSSIAYRYGLDIAYNFATTVYEVDNSVNRAYNDYDLSGVLGLKFNPKAGKNRMVIDFKFSILPIVDLNYAHYLETIKWVKVLPNQRNISLTVSIQHDFNN